MSLLPTSLGPLLASDPDFPVTIARSQIPLTGKSSNHKEWKLNLMDELDKVYWGYNKDSSYTGVALIGYEVGIKMVIYNDAIIADLRLAGAALICVVVLMWYYTGSAIITVLAFLEIFSSLGLGFLLYQKVVGIKFFPFMNAVTIFLAVGIGADDVFVYVDSWRHSKVSERITFPLTFFEHISTDFNSATLTGVRGEQPA